MVEDKGNEELPWQRNVRKRRDKDEEIIRRELWLQELRLNARKCSEVLQEAEQRLERKAYLKLPEKLKSYPLVSVALNAGFAPFEARGDLPEIIGIGLLGLDDERYVVKYLEELNKKGLNNDLAVMLRSYDGAVKVFGGRGRPTLETEHFRGVYFVEEMLSLEGLSTSQFLDVMQRLGYERKEMYLKKKRKEYPDLTTFEIMVNEAMFDALVFSENVVRYGKGLYVARFEYFGSGAFQSQLGLKYIVLVKADLC